jgi:ATP-dependent helicase/DNAse subunit B
LEILVVCTNGFRSKGKICNGNRLEPLTTHQSVIRHQVMPEPLKLSVSKTKTWNNCKKQYEFNYILRLPKVDKDYHLFGKILHLALEEFHLAYIKGWLLTLNEAMSAAWKKAKVKYADRMTPEALKECHQILASYLNLVASKPKTFLTNVLSVEQPFNFPLSDNIILNGFIDKVQLDNDGLIHISDYKSTKNKKYLKDDWFQLLTYAFVIMNEKPDIEKVRVSYILLRHDFEAISKEITREEAMKVKEQYIRYANDIESATEYPATTSRLCLHCDFLQSCPNGLEATFGEQTTHGEINW